MVYRRVEVDGAKQIAAAMAKASVDLEKKAFDPHAKAGALVQRAAEREVPRRTSTLAGTIRADSSNDGVEVSVGPLVYAGVIHFGTGQARGRPSNIKANKFLYRALDQSEGDVERIFERWMLKTVKEPIDRLP